MAVSETNEEPLWRSMAWGFLKDQVFSSGQWQKPPEREKTLISMQQEFLFQIFGKRNTGGQGLRYPSWVWCKTTPVVFEPTRGDPIGLAGRRLNRSAKVSVVNE